MHSPSHFESGPATISIQNLGLSRSRSATRKVLRPPDIPVKAGVLCVDLDETLLKGTVSHMTAEELEQSLLNNGVLAKIREARALGIPVVMVTRNSHELIERFFQAHPEARPLFDDLIACEVGSKGNAIKAWKQAHGIAEDTLVAFADDTLSEQRDVVRSVKWAQVCSPEQIGSMQLEEIRLDREKTRHLLN